MVGPLCHNLARRAAAAPAAVDPHHPVPRCGRACCERGYARQAREKGWPRGCGHSCHCGSNGGGEGRRLRRRAFAPRPLASTFEPFERLTRQSRSQMHL